MAHQKEMTHQKIFDGSFHLKYVTLNKKCIYDIICIIDIYGCDIPLFKNIS